MQIYNIIGILFFLYDRYIKVRRLTTFSYNIVNHKYNLYVFKYRISMI